MSARLVRGPQALLVRVTGELDVATAPVLDQVLRTATRLSSRDRGVWVDLGGLESVDDDGLAPLRWAHQRLLAAGRHLHLVVVPATVLRLLARLPDPQLLLATR